MKGTLDFDLDQRDYGPASREIRAVIRAYAEIDWFEPGGDLHGAADAFAEHQALARTHQPELFPPVEPRRAVGSWDDFAALCARVRNPDATSRWDWRMTALKGLATQHSRAHGWWLADQQASTPPAPGDLFMRVGESTIWSFYGPKIELPSDAAWYRSYATGDLLDAIQWWLAEPSATTNPFLPLLRCYGLGVYPFSLAATEVVLFAFRYAGGRLPTARIVR